jgi:transcriptional regulator with XRE-family HTH domain
MRSAVRDILPAPVRRSLQKLGADIAIARRKRRLTVLMMTERVGVSRATYARVEKGDPTVAVGVYAMCLFVLGFGAPLGELVDARRDELGLMLDEERLPKRIRPKKVPART